MATKSSKPTVPSKAKIDQVIDLKGLPFVVGLPDGTVVTGRGGYTVKRAGDHVFVVAGAEHTVEVSEK